MTTSLFDAAQTGNAADALVMTHAVIEAARTRNAAEGVAMTNAFIETMLTRSATKYYDADATLTDEQIAALVEIGTSAPTSFNLQNWRFVAVRSPEAKARLRPIAWNQAMTTEAAVTFVIVGQLADASQVPERMGPMVEAGYMRKDHLPEAEKGARSIYDDKPQQQRDEAIRTATFGAAAIIYAARSLGWGSTPMIGFDPAAARAEYGLANNEIPVMLLSVGPMREGNWPSKPRLPVRDVLSFR
jgi:nitroreductase